ncbi:hypothetical protein HK104_005301 [Borealophlyctis nickersoniae]|nr:hypothetical protein HK104_005301 [Borealophlyctis nickersoniae]
MGNTLRKPAEQAEPVFVPASKPQTPNRSRRTSVDQTEELLAEVNNPRTLDAEQFELLSGAHPQHANTTEDQVNAIVAETRHSRDSSRSRSQSRPRRRTSIKALKTSLRAFLPRKSSAAERQRREAHVQSVYAGVPRGPNVQTELINAIVAESGLPPTRIQQILTSLHSRLKSTDGPDDALFSELLYEARRIRWERAGKGITSAPQQASSQSSLGGPTNGTQKSVDEETEKAIMRDVYERAAMAGEDEESLAQMLLAEALHIVKTEKGSKKLSAKL